MYNDEIVIITAIEKEAAGTKTWLRERFTPGGLVRMFGEGLIKDYKQKMQILRAVDDKIHSWTDDFNSIIKNIDKAFASSRLVDLAELLKELNFRMSKVIIEGKAVERVTEEAIKEFEKQQNLKQAGLWSDLKREWVSRRFENEFRKARKLALKELIDFAKATVAEVNKTLNLMSKARASGNIGAYLDNLKNISKLQANFQLKFMPIYNKYLKNLVDEVEHTKKQQEEELKKQQLEQEKVYSPTESPAAPKSIQEKIITTPEVKKVEPEVVRISPDLNLGKQITPTEQEEEYKDDTIQMTPAELEEARKSTEEPEEQKTEEKIKTKSKKALSNFALQKQHINFLNSLAKAASEDLNEGIKLLLSYSQKIEDQDLDSSLKLLAIAEGFLNNE